MSNLQKYEDIIKEKKKSNSFNNYLKEIASLWPLYFHKRDSVISRYPVSSRMDKISTNEEFFSVMDSRYSDIEYDFTIDFWSNYKILLESIPFPNVINLSAENSDYADIVGWSKNAYLSFIVMESENVLYSYNVKDGSKNVLDSVFVNKHSENIFSSSAISSSQNIFYSRYIDNSRDVWFSSNLISCQECLFCSDLENALYQINNEKFSKEEYFKQKSIILSNKDKFEEWKSKVDKRGKNIGSLRVNGNSVKNSENVENGLFVQSVRNGRNLMMVGGASVFENCYDVYDSGTGDDSHDLYGLAGGGMGNNQYNCITSLGSYLYYCNFCWECSFCLGCVGIKNKTYCILNKQYKKEEWYELTAKIFEQMDKSGILGDFFPGHLNPFYFNDTMAYLLGNFKKEDIINEGFLWREDEVKVDIPTGLEAINTHDFKNYEGISSTGIWTLNPLILKKVIVDNSGKYYRIVPMELEFLQKHGLPLPKNHWLERIKSGFNF